LPGVVIGKEAFIGAGSLVTRNIKDGMLAYGSPAVPRRPVPADEKIYKK